MFKTCVMTKLPALKISATHDGYKYTFSSSSCSSLAQKPSAGLGHLLSEVSRSYTVTQHQSVGLPWTGDRPDAEAFT